MYFSTTFEAFWAGVYFGGVLGMLLATGAALLAVRNWQPPRD